MRYFLIVLLSVITFCAGAQVMLPDSIARFYLEQNERVKVYKVTVRDLKTEVSLLTKVNLQQIKIIETYKQDSVAYQDRIKTEKERADFNKTLFEREKREKRKFRRQRNMAIGASVGALGGSFIGPEGTVVGALAGGGIGFVVSLFKKDE